MSKNAIKDTKNISFLEAKWIYEFILENLAPKLEIPRENIQPIGSYGKKTVPEWYGDLDLGVKLDVPNPLLYLESKLSLLGYETKVMKGFNQISFGIDIPKHDGRAQVDFMISPDLKWTKFIYDSPDFKNKESVYKGVVRNLLLSAILMESYNKVIKWTDSKEIEELESVVIRMPYGIYRTRKSFMGKRGLVKTGKLMKEFDQFITRDPQEVVNLTIGNKYSKEDIKTFENMWKIINKPDFIHKDKLPKIIEKFSEYLESDGQPKPKEIIE
jgi:hypothetical protein